MPLLGFVTFGIFFTTFFFEGKLNFLQVLDSFIRFLKGIQVLIVKTLYTENDFFQQTSGSDKTAIPDVKKFDFYCIDALYHLLVGLMHNSITFLLHGFLFVLSLCFHHIVSSQKFLRTISSPHKTIPNDKYDAPKEVCGEKEIILQPS